MILAQGARNGFGLLLKCDEIDMVSEPIGTKTRGFENSKCEEFCLKDLKFFIKKKYLKSFSFSSSKQCEW